MPQFDTEALTNYERMKEKLTLQLVPAAKNKDLLADIRTGTSRIWRLHTAST